MCCHIIHEFFCSLSSQIYYREKSNNAFPTTPEEARLRLKSRASFPLGKAAGGTFPRRIGDFLHDARENITLFTGGRIVQFSKIRFWTIYKNNWLYISVACVIKCRQVCFKCLRSVTLYSCTMCIVRVNTRARTHACTRARVLRTV